MAKKLKHNHFMYVICDIDEWPSPNVVVACFWTGAQSNRVFLAMLKTGYFEAIEEISAIKTRLQFENARRDVLIVLYGYYKPFEKLRTVEKRGIHLRPLYQMFNKTLSAFSTFHFVFQFFRR